jgi:hypothetical protein
MTTFKLVHKATNAARATYHIANGRGDIVGSVSVKPDEVAALQNCWRNSTPTAVATARGEKARVVNAMLAATRKGSRMSKEASILRGC